MKLIYPSQSVASALRSSAPGPYTRVRDAWDRQYIWRPSAAPTWTTWHYNLPAFGGSSSEVPPDKGLPSFSATWEFDHSARQIDAAAWAQKTRFSALDFFNPPPQSRLPYLAAFNDPSNDPTCDLHGRVSQAEHGAQNFENENSPRAQLVAGDSAVFRELRRRARGKRN